MSNLLVSMRPRQWLKNLSLYAAITFWGQLFKWDAFLKVSLGVLVFCGLSSSMYLVNDAVDASKDRLHPVKKKRPVASGKLSPKLALLAAAIFALCSLLFAFFLSLHFFLLSLLFIALQLAYSFVLRDLIILDALAIALGFIFRVYGGAWIIPVPLSSWLVLAAIGLSLLIAFGKRRSERTLLDTREVLKHYPDALLDAMISMSSTFAILSYVLFAFQTSPRTTALFLTQVLPFTLAQPRWMMLTIPLVIYGVARYLYVIYEKKEGESPEKVLISDWPLLLSVVLWIASVIGIIYLLE